MRSHWTNRTVVNCTTTLLVAAGLLVACDRENEPMAPPASPSTEMQLDVVDQGSPVLAGPSQEAVATPVALDVDVSQLLPATVELAVPMVCGDLTVYDQEDVSTLCNPVTLAATPIVSPTCPQVVSGSVRLEVDLHCVNTSGLIVGGDNTVIDLNGHRIFCTGAGYFGSCQGLGFGNNGIQINHKNVHVFSHLPGGTIDGFHHGILVQPNSNNVKVKQLVITGPAGTPGARRPGFVIGIRVDGVDCEDGIVRLGGGTKTANDISHHGRGIQIANSTCVLIDRNRIHDNRKNQNGTAGDHAFGIALFSAPNIHLVGGVLTNNGDGDFLESGIGLIDGTVGTLVNNNQSNANRGNGIGTMQGANGNYIVNNEMLTNSFRDAFSDQSGVNQWNENNRCVTQTTPQPPPGVCGADEA